MDPTSGSFIKATKPFFACLMLSGGGVRWEVGGGRRTVADVQWALLERGRFWPGGRDLRQLGGSLGKRMGGRHLFHFGSFFYLKKKKNLKKADVD
jgi:hypothetical protein